MREEGRTRGVRTRGVRTRGAVWLPLLQRRGDKISDDIRA